LSSSFENSFEDSTTPELEIKPLGRLLIDEGKRLLFVVGITDGTLDDVRFSLANAPSGASISSSSGSFTWTPSKSQSGTYTFEIIATSGWLEDREPITITVNDIPEVTSEPEPTRDPEEPKGLGVAAFVDPSQDPQYYVDRYNNEPKYKEWFDENLPEYASIYQAVGLKEPEPEPEPEPQREPQREPEPEPLDSDNGGGCLIATATYGSELAPQVQQLRELRDNKLLQTKSGSAFMAGFNELYYSFSPGIADYERENPYFKEAVKLAITPMIASLSILNHVDMDTDADVLGYGISLILLNVGMYVGVPVGVVVGIKRI
jgi:hypothetical protein